MRSTRTLTHEPDSPKAASPWKSYFINFFRTLDVVKATEANMSRITPRMLVGFILAAYFKTQQDRQNYWNNINGQRLGESLSFKRFFNPFKAIDTVLSIAELGINFIVDAASRIVKKNTTYKANIVPRAIKFLLNLPFRIVKFAIRPFAAIEQIPPIEKWLNKKKEKRSIADTKKINEALDCAVIQVKKDKIELKEMNMKADLLSMEGGIRSAESLAPPTKTSRERKSTLTGERYHEQLSLFAQVKSVKEKTRWYLPKRFRK